MDAPLGGVSYGLFNVAPDVLVLRDGAAVLFVGLHAGRDAQAAGLGQLIDQPRIAQLVDGDLADKPLARTISSKVRG